MSQSLHPEQLIHSVIDFPAALFPVSALCETPFPSRHIARAQPRSPGCIPQGSEGKPGSLGAQTRALLAKRLSGPKLLRKSFKPELPAGAFLRARAAKLR